MSFLNKYKKQFDDAKAKYIPDQTKKEAKPTGMPQILKVLRTGVQRLTPQQQKPQQLALHSPRLPRT